VDGIVGHFQLLSETKTGVKLAKDSKQFVVIEAKMFSHARVLEGNGLSHSKLYIR